MGTEIPKTSRGLVCRFLWGAYGGGGQNTPAEDRKPKIRRKRTASTNSVCPSESTYTRADGSPLAYSDYYMTIDDFELLRVLGKGAFGKVLLCRQRSSEELCAIKIVRKPDAEDETHILQALSECHILQKARHPFLTQLRYAFQSVDKLFMAMDYACGGDMYTHLWGKVLSEESARFYAAEIVLGLEHLHREKIIYRDLKLENLLIDRDGHVKITDFGLSKAGVDFGETTSTLCGTPSYFAPEALEGKGYDHAVDWWCLGVVMHKMMTGQYPFDHPIADLQNLMIRKKQIKMPATFSADAKSLVSGLLTKSPEKRLGGGKRRASDIKQHAFFRDVSWTKLLAKEVTPPFVPALASDCDTSYFDAEYTRESVNLELSCTAELQRSERGSGHKRYISQFSFYGPSQRPSTKATPPAPDRTSAPTKRARL